MNKIGISVARDIFYALYTAAKNTPPGLHEASTLTSLALMVLENHPEEHVREWIQDLILRTFKDETEAVLAWSAKAYAERLHALLEGDPVEDKSWPFTIDYKRLDFPPKAMKKLTITFTSGESITLFGSEDMIDKKIDEFLKDPNVSAMKFRDLTEDYDED